MQSGYQVEGPDSQADEGGYTADKPIAAPVFQIEEAEVDNPDTQKECEGRQRVDSTESNVFRGLAINDLVQIASGEQGSDVLWPGEVGQVLQDKKHGSEPFQVQGPRGDRAWFRGESLVPHSVRRRTTECSPSRKRRPLIQQVASALDPDVCLDFPTITDICEAAAANPDGADVALTVLVATLGEQQIKPGDTRNITQDYLKVLTIFNEMLYDNALAEVLRSTAGLQSALERLRGWRVGDLGDSADENIRMLATEVERRVFEGTGKAGKPNARTEIIEFCPKGHLLTWSDGLSRFHIHQRKCACCQIVMTRLVQRYACRTCYYYDVCIPCVRWGRPVRTQSSEAPELKELGAFLEANSGSARLRSSSTH